MVLLWTLVVFLGCPRSREPVVVVVAAAARGGLRISLHHLWGHHSIGLAPHHYRHQRGKPRLLPVASQRRRSSQLAKDAVQGRSAATASFRPVKVVLKLTSNVLKSTGLGIIMCREGEESCMFTFFLSSG